QRGVTTVRVNGRAERISQEEPMSNQPRAQPPTGPQAAGLDSLDGPRSRDRANGVRNSGPAQLQMDYIDEAIEESGPAADPPALAAAAAIAPPGRTGREPGLNG